MKTSPPDHQPQPSDSGADPLEALLLERFQKYGKGVCEQLLSQIRRPSKMAGLLRRLGVSPQGDTAEQLKKLEEWLASHGAETLSRTLGVMDISSTGKYVLKPVDPHVADAHRQRMVELMVKSGAKPAPHSPFAPTGPGYPPPQSPGPQPAQSANSPRPPAASALNYPYPEPQPPGGAPPSYPAVSRVGIPAPGVPGALAQAGPSSAPAYPVPPSDETALHGGFSGPPGYPYPWPSHLRPGPAAPPPNLPPDQLTWPYVERRDGKERRFQKDRRGNIETIFRNKRYGGERRKGNERRKNPPFFHDPNAPDTKKK